MRVGSCSNADTISEPETLLRSSPNRTLVASWALRTPCSANIHQPINQSPRFILNQILFYLHAPTLSSRQPESAVRSSFLDFAEKERKLLNQRDSFRLFANIQLLTWWFSIIFATASFFSNVNMERYLPTSASVVFIKNFCMHIQFNNYCSC